MEGLWAEEGDKRAVLGGKPIQPMASEPLECGKSELRCATGIKYTLDLQDFVQ